MTVSQLDFNRVSTLSLCGVERLVSLETVLALKQFAVKFIEEL